MTLKVNCYKCIHKGTVPGSAHLCCKHPEVEQGKNPLAEIASILGGGTIRSENGPGEKLGIKMDAHGVARGWCNWPYDFDPVWLIQCQGFIEKREEKKVDDVV